MIIKKMIEDEIEISDYDNNRCSRNCPYCWKECGLYKCFRLDREGEEIELLDDINVEDFDTSHTYGFQRTKSCLNFFGIDNTKDLK